MGRVKLTMELIANEKIRYRTFRNRQKGLKKKLHELSTLCDVKACMIMYCPNGYGTFSSQPDVWPENHYEFGRIVNKYINERKEGHGKRTVSLSDILESRKKKVELELQKLQEKKGKTKGQTSETGLELDGLSYEKLMEIDGKLEKKLESVKSLIDSKKGEAGLMSKTPVNCPHMPGLPTAEPLDDIHVPMDYSAFQGTEMVLYDLGAVESDLNWMMMNMENNHSTQFQGPIHCDPAHGMFENNTDSSTSYQKMGTVPTMQGMFENNSDPSTSYQKMGTVPTMQGMFENNSDPSTSYQKMGTTVPTMQGMWVSENTMMLDTNSMPQMGFSENTMFDIDHSISMQQISAYMQYLLA